MLRDIFDYLNRHDIRMYRMSSDVVPYGTHPEMPQFHNQIDECADELRELGEKAKELDIRLSLHPSQFVVLNAEDEEIAGKAIADLTLQSELLDVMGLDLEAVVVTHVGGVYGSKQDGLERFVERWHKMPESARRRVVVENDERLYSVEDTLWINRRTGTRLIFDYQHHMLNSGKLNLTEALESCLDSWPAEQTPKIHFSSPRTEMRTLERKSPATGKKEQVYQPPLISQHSDYINPLEFALFMEKAHGLRFDVMLEAKSKDLALIALRKFLEKAAMSNEG
jgi:UV DNA damage endonuclease